MGGSAQRKRIADHPLLTGVVIAIVGAAATACFAAVWPSDSRDTADPPGGPVAGPNTEAGPRQTTQSAGSQTGQPVFLMDLPPVADANRWDSGAGTLRGASYPNSVIGADRLFGEPELVDYNLGGRYTRFRATVGVDDNAPRDVKYRFEVLTDGKSRFSRTLDIGQTAVVDIDITGVLRLTLLVDDSPGDYASYEGAIWGDATLVRG